MLFFNDFLGRNDRGQLGVGDEIRRDQPVTPPELEDLVIVEAALGKNHTIFVTGNLKHLLYRTKKKSQIL